MLVRTRMEKQVIIFEGSDLAGKTTLANLVAKRFESKFVHFGVPGPNTNHVDEFCKALETNPYNTVYDRGCLSDFAYSFKWITDPNRKPNTAKQLWRGVQMMKDEKALLILVYAEDHILKKRLKERSDDYISEKELLTAKVNYEIIWESLISYGIQGLARLVVRTYPDSNPENIIHEHIDAIVSHLK